ncbi:unnamed protein product [Chironomus riparius]|uniref:Uncharacterized protein n=1 Tax=Chironomus riparius TaxID=315576 RepID=A0A9N9WZD1_9DIPT|nr:unnamed protein product [Chironomus riparius]
MHKLREKYIIPPEIRQHLDSINQLKQVIEKTEMKSWEKLAQAANPRPIEGDISMRSKKTDQMSGLSYRSQNIHNNEAEQIDEETDSEYEEEEDIIENDINFQLATLPNHKT